MFLYIAKEKVKEWPALLLIISIKYKYVVFIDLRSVGEDLGSILDQIYVIPNKVNNGT